MKVLITGSTSLIGRHIGKIMGEQHDVFYAGRRECDFYLDLSQIEPLFPSSERFDVVVHCAADFGGNTPQDLMRAEITNAIGTLNIASIARHARASHLILLSSCFAGNTPSDYYYGAYSLSKRHGEELAMLACGDAGVPLTILRPAQVYGDSSAYAKHQALLYRLIDLAARGEEIILYGQQDPERQFLHVDDLAAIVRGTIEQKILGLHVVGSNRAYRISEIADLAYATFGTNGRVRFDVSKPDIPMVKEVIHSPLLASMGLNPATDLAEGLRRIRDLNGGKQ